MDKEEVERGIISITPEAIKPNGGVRRNSTGKVNTRVSPSFLSSDEKLLPHYLRASTSSCHDFCKYGRKHVFEAKKRHSILPKLLGNNEAPHKEQNQAKVYSLLERRKKPELKPMATSQPKDPLSDKSKLIKQKGPSSAKEIWLSDTPTNPAEGLSEESASMKLKTPSPFQEGIPSVENTPSSEGEGSSEEPISIKQVIPANGAEGLSEEPVSIKLETPSPIQKSITSDENTPLTWPEGSSDGSVSMELESPSLTQESIEFPEHITPMNQVEESSEEPAGLKLMTASAVPESNAHADEPTRMKLKTTPSIRKSIVYGGPINVKHKARPPTRKSIASTILTSAIRAEKSSKEALSMKMKIPSPVHKSIASAVNQAEELSVETNQAKSLKIRDGKKREVAKLKTAPQEKTVVSESRPIVYRKKKNEVTGEPNMVKKKTPSPIEKTITSVKPKITEHKSPSSVKKAIASLSPKVLKQKASSPIKRTGVPAQPSISLKSMTPVVKSTSALISSARRNHGNKLIRSADLTKMGEQKVFKPPRASLSPKPPVNGVSSVTLRKSRSTKPASPIKNQAKAGKVEHNSEKVMEKTLYVIEPKPANTIPKSIKQKPRKKKSYPSSQTSSSTSLSSPSSVSSLEKEEQEYSESTLSEASELVLDNEGTKRNKPGRSPKGEDQRRPRRTATVRSEDKSPAPHKLKFRRGKVVSLQSENNGPRKLRFRQVKGVSENQNSKGETEKKSFRKRGEADLNPPISEAPTVVLRHQDVQEKKDSQGLFNNVIEETASKLVETRKSKVKALVGAFETVISLQDGRVAPTV